MEIVGLLGWSSVGPALLFALLFLVFNEIFKFISLKNRFPPGPKPWPLFGNLPSMLKDPFRTIDEIATFGEISTIFLGRKPSIVLNKLQITKEALVQNGIAFSGRPALPIFDWITKGNGIVMAAFGHSWRQQRKFASLTLKNFGLGKKSMEERIKEETHFLVEELEKAGRNPMDPQQVLQNAVSNIICSLVFGDRYEYTDKHFNNLLNIISENIFLSGSALGQVFNLIPVIKHIPGPHQQINRNANELKSFIRQMADVHRKTLDRDNLRDFIDAYLVEMEKQASSSDSTFFEDNMVLSVADLFLAGTDTTSTTLRWGLMYMMEHPDIQERCHKEIVHVLGFERKPSMDDRTDLPYTYATIHEVQRHANIAPLGIVHETTQVTQLRGYTLPKGIDVFVNLTAILTDKDYWKYPKSFNPENFLDDEGKFCKQESFLAFSLGPRVCLGEQLARTELFLFFTSLLQRLRFSWPLGAEHPDMKGNFSVVRSPKAFTMLCHSRSASN